MIDHAFAYAGFHPKVLFESISTHTVLNMVREQIAPAFFPQSYVDPSAPMVYFTVAPAERWTRSVAFLKGSYLTRPEKYFIALARPAAGKHGKNNLITQTGFCPHRNGNRSRTVFSSFPPRPDHTRCTDHQSCCNCPGAGYWKSSSASPGPSELLPYFIPFLSFCIMI